MRRLWALWLLSVTALCAGDTLEIYATKLENVGSVTRAEHDVLILYKDLYLSANRAVYDREAEVLELSGSVTVMKGTDTHILGEYVRLDLKNDTRQITPFYMIDKKTQLWLSCEKASEKGVELELETGMISGCDPNDPIWKFRFSSSDYNRETKWINLYNSRLVIAEVPVLYLPYFGYSLDFERRTGLLPPSIGASGSEGFYFEQPLYVAEQNWWDLEVRPQVRTLRGRGLYGDFRFVDSPVSFGTFSMGYFSERSDYVRENDLANDSHYGLNFSYQNQNVLKEWLGIHTLGQSGAYFDINLMNDIDYVNLAYNDTTKNATTSQVNSRINLFYNLDHQYFGTYFKYYLDLEKENNDDTVQNLPTLQYHRYLSTWFDDHLFYTLDLQADNYSRRVGITAEQVEMNLPVTVRTSVLDEYLDLSYTTQMYGKYLHFDNSDPAYDSGGFGRNTNVITLGTELARGYEDFAHTMALRLTFVRNGFDERDGYFQENERLCESDPNNDICSYYKVTEVEEETKIQFSQYLFEGSGNRVLYHRLTQAISSVDNKAGEMENEIEWQVTPEMLFYTDTIYDHEEHGITKQLTSLDVEGEQTTARISHFYEDRVRRDQSSHSNYMTVGVDYRYNDHYRYFFNYAYDIEQGIKKNAEAGFLYSKRCWDFGLRYVENNRPVLQSGGAANSIYDKYIYMTITLKPIGGSEFGYQMSNNLEGS